MREPNERITTTTTRPALLLAAFAALAAPAGAQQKNPKDAAAKAKTATLAQAVVVEIYEHNLGKAMQMYRAIAADEDRRGDTRTQARLRLAKAYRRLGQQAEAQAALRKAAQGSGAAAKEAAAILAGAEQDGGDLVKAKVQQALMAMRLTGKADRTDLTWIGQPAVPYVIKAVDAEKADLRFISNAAEVLFRLGGPEVLKWIDKTKQSEDVLRKRAVIKGYHRAKSEDVRKKVVSFLADKDPTVRLEVMQRGSTLLDAEAVIAALQDESADVRSYAMSVLRDSWRALRHGDRAFANFKRVLPYLEKVSGSYESNAYASLSGWLAGGSGFPAGGTTTQSGHQRFYPFPATDDGRRTYLRAVTVECLRHCKVKWRRFEIAPTNALSEEIVAAARKVKVPHGGIGTLSAAHAVYDALKDVLRVWDHASMGAVLELVRFGYDVSGQLSRWVSEHGTAEDLAAVAERLDDFDERKGIEYVCNWMTNVGTPDAVLDRLTALADRLHGPKTNRRQSSRFRAVIRTIRSINSQRSIDYLVSRIADGRQSYLQCLQNRANAADEKAILLRLLVLPGEGESVREMRKYAFKMLLRLHENPGDPMLFARAYELGMGSALPAVDPNRNVSTSGARRRGLFYACAGRGATSAKASPRRRAAVLDACLATGNAEAFKDIAYAMRWTTSREIADVVCKHVARAPKLLDAQGRDVRPGIVERAMRNLAHGEAGAALAVAALTHEEPAIRRTALRTLDHGFASEPAVARAVLAKLRDEDVAVRRLAASILSYSDAEVDGLVKEMTVRLTDDDPDVVIHAIRFHGHRNPASLLMRKGLLKHRDPNVRYQMATEILRARGTAVIDDVGPLLGDERISPNSRKALCKTLGSLMDLRVVPHLLQALKSPALQAEAQKQLEAVRFYHEESSKWNRVMAGGGFTETSAAEALVKQAKAGRKDVRVAAIASLGTLAEPETLPFLVQLIGDSDADIAKAAKDAVERINRSAKKK